MHSNIVGVRSRPPRAVAAILFSLSALGALVASPLAASAAMTGVSFTKVHAGLSTNCALTTTGTLYCWGANDYGQLLNGSTSPATTPTLLDLTSTLNGASIVDFANGSGTTCVLATANHVYCWGYGGQGQLGNGGFALAHVPVAVSFSGVTGTISHIAGTGSTSFCVSTTTSQIWCWGGNAYGSLGNGALTNSDVPVAVDRSGVLSGKTLSTLAGSADTYCVLDSTGKAYCWGDGRQGALGNGTKSLATIPVAVTISGDLLGKTLNAIAPTSSHTCALDTAHQLFCWGTNNFGTNGLGLPDGQTHSSSAQLTPKHVASISSVTLSTLSSGGTESCATSSGGALYCWGGEPVGDGYVANDALAPVLINGGMLSSKTVSNVSSGDYNTCAVDSDGSLYCWGIDDNNEIGDNSTSTSYYPNEIAIAPSASSTATVPGAPRAVTQFASPGSITVHWAAAFNDGGSVITSYIASANDGTNTYTCSGANVSATSCTINALVNGTTYDVSVSAKNAVGTSSPVHAGTATPVSLPDAPISVSAVGASQALKVTWAPGASNGGSAIVSFTATAKLLSTTKSCTATGAGATTCTISALVNGANYAVTVIATNSLGPSVASSPVNATPAAVPSAPTQLKVTPAAGSIGLSWSAPSSNGGSAITGYAVSASPGGATCTTTAVILHCTISSLVPTTGYTFDVRAVNIVGASAPATSVVAYPFSASTLTMMVASNVLNVGASFKIILAGSTPNAKATVTIGSKVATCVFNVAHQCTVSMSLSTTGTFRAVAKVGGTPATLALYVPLVNAPAKAFHKKSFKVTITNCPANVAVKLSFSNGQSVTVKSTFKGIGFATVTLPKTGIFTMTTKVAFSTLSPTIKIKII